MTLIDTHAHIYSKEFNPDLTQLIIRAKDAGLSSILMPAVDSSSHEAMLELEKNYPGFCQSMMGLHPCSVAENYEEELKQVETHLANRKFIAVGEIGLDFYWDLTYKEQQYEAFNRQTAWALQYDIPIVIHSRNATDECIKVVADHQDGKLRGVFHCFSGTKEQAEQIIALGFYLGIGGVITFKNAGLIEAIQTIDLKHVVLETDAPYLAPVPFRGKRNECSYITYIAQKLADSRELLVDEVAAITTANAQKLFSL